MGDEASVTFVPAGPASTPMVARDPHIALTWLVRLRWLAVVGQVAAVAVATILLHITLPLGPIAGVVLTTLITNVVLFVGLRAGMNLPSALVPVVLLLDIGLLTVLLYYTGGPTNPFGTLYLVNVAMAVVVLQGASAWLIVGAAAVCHGLLLLWHVPLEGLERPSVILPIGSWVSLVLASLLITYFIRRVIADARRRDTELLAMREQMARSEQLASLATLAAGAAHELNTPLGTIALVSKEIELATRNLDPPALADDARLIRSEVERCRRILDRMRVGKAEALNQTPREVGIDELIQAVRDDLKPGEPDRLDIDAQNVHSLVVPLRAAVQALVVLIRNGFDAGPPDGRVKLVIRQTNQGAVFQVIDHGRGMPPEVLRRAGEPFFTTKEPGQGMGLGLFLVRIVAERYGGTFKLRSSLTEGTRCVLIFPRPPGGGSAEHVE